MAQVGVITVQAKLDSKDFEKDLKNLNNILKQMNISQIEGLSKIVSNLTKQSGRLKTLCNNIDKVGISVKNLAIYLHYVNTEINNFKLSEFSEIQKVSKEISSNFKTLSKLLDKVSDKIDYLNRSTLDLSTYLHYINLEITKFDISKFTSLAKEIKNISKSLESIKKNANIINDIVDKFNKAKNAVQKAKEETNKFLVPLGNVITSLMLINDNINRSLVPYREINKSLITIGEKTKSLSLINDNINKGLVLYNNNINKSLVLFDNINNKLISIKQNFLDIYGSSNKSLQIPKPSMNMPGDTIEGEYKIISDEILGKSTENFKNKWQNVISIISQSINKIKTNFSGFKSHFSNVIDSLKTGITSLGKSLYKNMAKFTKETLKVSKKWGQEVSQVFKKISMSFKTFMFALGVDFSIFGFIKALKDSVSEMTDMQSTVLGFTTMISVQGQEVNKANKFVKKYASDGLVSLQGAMTQYKNYSLRGFSQENIEELMTIAKDFAVVNKKAGVGLEEALINLSEGIKLDLSRLMDASGLSKNLSNIYSDYANAINKDVSNLTDKERNKAILKYFEEMNRYSKGNAEKISKTFIGTVSKLKTQTKYMFAELGNTIAFIAKPFLEDLIKAFAKLEQIFKSVNDFIRNSVFGVNNKMKELADEYNKIQNSVENITDLTDEQKTQADALLTQYESIRVALKSIEKSIKNVVDSIFVITRNANGEITKLFGVTKEEVNEYKGLEKNSKSQLDNLVNLSEEKADFKQVVDDSTKSLEEEANAAEKVLAPFDTINQMKFKTGGEEDEPQELISEDTSENAKEEVTETIFWLDFLKTAINKFLKDVDFEPLKESWERLKFDIFGNDFSKGVNTFYDILKNIVSFILEKALPTILNITSIIIEAFKNANINFEPLKKSFKELFDTIFGENGENLESTVGFLFNEIIIPVFKWFIEWALPKIITLLDRVFKFVQEYSPYLVKAVKELWEILEPIIEWVYQRVIDLFDWFSKQDDDTKERIAKLIIAIGAIGIALNLLWPIITFIGGAFASLVKIITKHSIGDLIWIGIKKLGTLLSNTALPWLTNVFFPAAWSAIKTALTTIGKGIFTAVKTFLSSTIGKVIISFIAGFKLGQYIAEHWFTEEDLKAFYWNVMTAVDSIKTWFYNVVEDIKDFFKSIPDAVKGFFNDLKNWFNNLDLFGGIFEDADSLGDVLGNAWDKLTGKNKTGSTSNPLDGYYGYTSPYFRAAATSYTVPAYANGVVLPANSPRLAIVGDQKQGTSIETQIATMMEAMQRVLSQNQNGQVIQNVLKVDGQVLYKSNNKVSRQRGAKMISR